MENKNFFKNFFSQRTMNIVVGTCICIWAILFTLFIIEVGLFSDSNGVERWTSRIDEWDEFISSEKEKVDFFTDTINGDMFSFKGMLVIPWVEITSNSYGLFHTILNFKIYDTNRKTEYILFQTNQEISNSKLIQAKNHLIWFIEADEQFFIYDEQGTDLIACSYPSGYSFVYPEISDIDIENLDPGEKSVVDKDIKKPDTYWVNNSLSSFSVIDNMLLFYAQKDNDKQYWAYDLEARTIQKLTEVF